MSRIKDIYQQLQQFGSDGASAEDIGAALHIDRSTASRYLNDLVKADRVVKRPGKPVKYVIKQSNHTEPADRNVIGAGERLQTLIETVKAAILYHVKSCQLLQI